MHYLDNATTTTTYTGAFSLSTGTHTLNYRSIDNVGNAQAWQTVTYRVGTLFSLWAAQNFTPYQSTV